MNFIKIIFSLLILVTLAIGTSQAQRNKHFDVAFGYEDGGIVLEGLGVLRHNRK